MLHKVASIVPLAHLELTRDDDYFMALSYACSDPRYVEFFRARAKEGKHVILDNSAVEKSEPEDLESYLTKAVDMNASEILSPDYFRNSSKTFLAIGPTFVMANRFDYQGKIMVVPQGQDIDYFMNFVRAAAQDYPIHTIGISRRYTEMFSGRRSVAVGMVRKVLLDVDRADVNIHLLGCWDHPRHDIGDSLANPYVNGIDGSLPSIFAKYDKLLEENADRPGPVIDILKDQYDEDFLTFNLSAFRRLCGPIWS